MANRWENEKYLHYFYVMNWLLKVQLIKIVFGIFHQYFRRCQLRVDYVKHSWKRFNWQSAATSALVVIKKAS